MRKSRQPSTPEMDRLELTIRRLLDSHEQWRRRAEVAEARVAELQARLQQVTKGDLDPVALADQVRELEQRNRDLRGRMDSAHAAVERMRARLQFAEEER
ncbi:MAG TPA: hypothetical protein VK928_07455 [Longimicrobiales bacterium]|nr:hypothetical protein [Longimicrobiales bacterium]